MIRKAICYILCVLTLCVSSLALAADVNDYYAQDDLGNWYFDEDAYNAAVALERVTADGYASEYDVSSHWYTDEYGIRCFDKVGFEVDYAAFLAAVQEPAFVESPEEIIESDDVNDGDQTPAVDISSLTPIGNYLADEVGNLYYPNGEPASGLTPAGDVPAPVSVSDDVLDPQVPPQVPPVETGLPVYSLTDLRSADDPVVSPDLGLKSLVVSIFGNYQPVTEETVITETIDGDTVDTTIRTVVPGFAGVDFQWIGSVMLFGLLLLCLGKMLGGILKG